jgi:hypothetical protein
MMNGRWQSLRANTTIWCKAHGCALSVTAVTAANAGLL